MKIIVGLGQETITENGRVVPSGSYEALYDCVRGLHGYDDAKNMNRYDALRLNERLIERAVTNADEADADIGFVEHRGKTCHIQLFPTK